MNSVLNSNIEDIRELKRILFDLLLKYDTIDNEDLKADIKAIIQTGDKLYSELVLDNRKTRPTKKAIDLTTGEDYNSPKEMAEHFGVSMSSVYGACNGYHLLKGHKVAYG